MTPWWAALICLAAFFPYALFVGFYFFRSPWQLNPTGRTLMLSKFAIMLLLGHVLVVLFVGDYPGRIYVWAGLFVLLSIAGSAQLANLLHLQRQAADGHPRRRVTD